MAGWERTGESVTQQMKKQAMKTGIGWHCDGSESWQTKINLWELLRAVWTVHEWIMHSADTRHAIVSCILLISCTSNGATLISSFLSGPAFLDFGFFFSFQSIWFPLHCKQNCVLMNTVETVGHPSSGNRSALQWPSVKTFNVECVKVLESVPLETPLTKLEQLSHNFSSIPPYYCQIIQFLSPREIIRKLQIHKRKCSEISRWRNSVMIFIWSR